MGTKNFKYFLILFFLLISFSVAADRGDLRRESNPQSHGHDQQHNNMVPQHGYGHQEQRDGHHYRHEEYRVDHHGRGNERFVVDNNTHGHDSNRGHYYKGGYYKYRHNGGYYNYRHNGEYYRYYKNGGYYNYLHNGRYFVFFVNGQYYNFFYKGAYYSDCKKIPGHRSHGQWNPEVMVCH